MKSEVFSMYQRDHETYPGHRTDRRGIKGKICASVSERKTDKQKKSTAYGSPVQRNSQGHTSLSTSNRNATHTADPAIENGPAAVDYREKNQTSYERRHNTCLRGA
ncbi:hypothetical protein B0H14DRAFT_2558982 [Mycena olivaceomarginata]|nr:hypothetical protein B0H14DRAFT_2558982 [Mycena olivaceomarginata]